MSLIYCVDIRLSPTIRLHPRHETIRPLLPASDRAGPPTNILQCTHICTGEEHGEEAVRR